MLYFALVNDGEAFDPVTHAREDLTVFDLAISQREGEFARADLQVWNPRAALPANRLYISEDGVLLFSGEVSRAPRGQVSERIRIEVIGRPSDADARLATLVEGLKVAPYYDPLFVASGDADDAGTVLTGHGKVLAWGRVSGDVSAVDFLSGSSTVALTPFRGSVSVDVADDVPATASYSMKVQWGQLRKETYGPFDELKEIKTLTPDGLLKNWPKVGTSLGGGFSVTRSSVEETSYDFRKKGKSDDPFVKNREDLERFVDVKPDELDPVVLADGKWKQVAEKATLAADLVIQNVYEIRRTETATVSVSAGVQAVIRSGSAEDEALDLQDITQSDAVSSWAPRVEYLVGAQVLDGGNVYEAREDHISGAVRTPGRWNLVGESSYLSSRRVYSFFRTSRGQAAIDHAVERLKARLRYAARAVRISFDCAMPDPASITADMTATISDPALPGGSATGRVVGYDLEWGGGRKQARIEMACAAGTGIGAALTIAPASGSVPYSNGRLSLSVEDRAEAQIASFDAGDAISPTVVNIEPTPAPATDVNQTADFQVSGEVLVPKQIDLQ